MTISVEQPIAWFVSRGFGSFNQPWLWRQVMGMDRLQAEVVCWGRANPKEYPALGVPVHELPFPPAPYEGSGRWRYRLRNLGGGNFFAARGDERTELSRLLAARRPSVVLCHFGDVAMRLLPLARAFRTPVVAHFHGVFQNLKDRWYRWSLLRCLPQFDAVVVVNTEEEKWMLEHGVAAGRLHVVPCGAPADVFHPRPHVRVGNTIRFVVVSRLVGHKGVDYVIRAFAQVAAILPSARLDIFGEGPDGGQLRGLVRQLELERLVRFHGYVTEQALAEQLPRFDVFVQHSVSGRSGWREGSPVSVVEAAACQLPVVVSDCGGQLDQVTDGYNGFVVRQRDVSAIARAMRTLAADWHLRQRMGVNGRRRVLECFDTRLQVQRLQQVLLQVAGAQECRDEPGDDRHPDGHARPHGVHAGDPAAAAGDV
jgi:colanic acid/amylovoran biosynthesis glycosyltransferase